MPGILYKDLKLCRGTFIGQAIMLIITNSMVLIPYLADRKVYSDSTDGSDPLLGMMCIFTALISFYVGGMLQETIISSDERRKWAYLMSASPDGIKKQVAGKYALMVIYSAITAFVCMFMNSLTADIIGKNVPPASGLILILFFVQLMIRAINAPFIFAFSSKYGNTVRLAAVSIVITAGIIYGLFGDLSWINLDKVWEKLLKLLTDLNESVKLLWAQVIFFGGVTVLYIFSYKLSCKLYLKGAEQYDK